MKNKFTFIDLFAGIGGFHYGSSQCGCKCVMASEIDPIATETYYQNYKLRPSNPCLCPITLNG